MRFRLAHLVLVLLVTPICVQTPASSAPPNQSQTLSPAERKIGRQMLRDIVLTLRQNYYDPGFHGVDLDSLTRKAEEQIDRATNADLVFATLADVLDSLKDSHTFFTPPTQPYVHNYGWKMEMIGGRCFIVTVQKGSDAEAKGLRIGDELKSINGVNVNRDNLDSLRYFYGSLSPQTGLRLIVQTANGERKQFGVAAKLEKREGQTGWQIKYIRNAHVEDIVRAYRHRNMQLCRLSEQVAVWPLRSFFLDDEDVDDVMSKARKYKSLIVDLRGNPGGSIDTLARVMGHFFTRETKISDLHERKKTRTLKARPSSSPFKGEVIVLLDSDSNSAAEVFARIIQLGGRGKVLGDRTGGSVMAADEFQLEMGINTEAWYYVSVTVADVIMPDGVSLEKVGVAPDELLLPTADDLATKRDPILARAAAVLGVTLTPQSAGELSQQWSANTSVKR